MVLHVLNHVRPLALIWGYHTNLVWFHTTLHQTGYNLLNICSLGPVQVTRTRGGDFLLSWGEEGGLVGVEKDPGPNFKEVGAGWGGGACMGV